MTDERARRARVRVTGPPRRRHTPHATDRRHRRADRARRRLPRAACSASSSPWPCGSSGCSSSPSARCRCCSASSPSWPRSTSSGCPLAWLLLGVLVYPWLLLLGFRFVRRRRAQRARLRAPPPGPRRGRRETHDHGRRTGAGRAGGGQPRDAGDRHLRAADLAHHQRLLRRLAQRPARPQRLGDRRRVPLRRVVPRRRRAGAHRRRADALVPGRLDRRLPRAAGPRRRPAAPQRRLHAARLRRGPAGFARVRALCSVLVVAIGWLYLLPQFQGAGLTLTAAIDAPTWVGAVVVGVVVVVNVGSGGMRSITFVQAFQYWLKLTALLVPAVVLLVVWAGDGRPRPGGGGRRLVDAARRGQPGPLHDVLDHRGHLPRHHGAAARRGPLLHQPRRPGRPPHHAVVLALLGVFYLLPPIYAALGRAYGAEADDTVVLELPRLMLDGLGGDLLTGARRPPVRSRRSCRPRPGSRSPSPA